MLAAFASGSLADALAGFLRDERCIFFECIDIAAPNRICDFHAELIALLTQFAGDGALASRISVNARIEEVHHVCDGNDARFLVLGNHLDAVVFAPEDVRYGNPDGRAHLGGLDPRCTGPRRELEEADEISLGLLVLPDVVGQADSFKEREAVRRVVARFGHELTTRDILHCLCIRFRDVADSIDDVDGFAAPTEALQAKLLAFLLGNALAKENGIQVLVEAGDERRRNTGVRVCVDAILVQLMRVYVCHEGLL